MISFKVQTYLYDLLQYLDINKKENYNLIKKFREIIPFLQYIDEDVFFEEIEYLFTPKDKVIFLILKTEYPDTLKNKNSFFIGDLCSFLAQEKIDIDFYKAYVSFYVNDPIYSYILTICDQNYSLTYLNMFELIDRYSDILNDKETIKKLLIKMINPFFPEDTTTFLDIYNILFKKMIDINKSNPLAFNIEDFKILEQLKEFINIEDYEYKYAIFKELLETPLIYEESLDIIKGCLKIIRKNNIIPITLIRNKPEENE